MKYYRYMHIHLYACMYVLYIKSLFLKLNYLLEGAIQKITFWSPFRFFQQEFDLK